MVCISVWNVIVAEFRSFMQAPRHTVCRKSSFMLWWLYICTDAVWRLMRSRHTLQLLDLNKARLRTQDAFAADVRRGYIFPSYSKQSITASTTRSLKHFRPIKRQKAANVPCKLKSDTEGLTSTNCEGQSPEEAADMTDGPRAFTFAKLLLRVFKHIHKGESLLPGPR